MRNKVLISIGGCVLFTALAVTVAWRHIVSESKYVGTVLGVSKVRIEEGPLQDASVKLHTLQFRLPAEYEIRPMEDDERYQERFSATARRDGVRHLVITTKKYSNIDDFSGVEMRRRSPRLYREERNTVAGLPAISFTASSSEGYEQVVFIQHGMFITSVAISTDSAFVASLAKQEMTIILESVEWLL